MTTAEKIEAKKAYDIARRPFYKERKAQLRKTWKDTEQRAFRSRISNPKVWASYMIARIKHRSKKRGIEFTITAADLVLPDKCPVLGIPLTVGIGHKFRTHPGSPSVDRFDNTKGYTPENIRVISNRANILKNNASLEEMRAILRYMEGDVS